MNMDTDGGRTLNPPITASNLEALSVPPAPHSRLREAFERILRPAVGFTCPDDVVKDPWLDADEKRAILSSWASDASAVEGRPELRWLLGTPEPVRRADVAEALEAIERRIARAAAPFGPPALGARQGRPSAISAER